MNDLTHKQPRRVGSFSGGGGELICRMPHIFQIRKSRRTNESRGASTLAGWARPPKGPPDATGLPISPQIPDA